VTLTRLGCGRSDDECVDAVDQVASHRKFPGQSTLRREEAGARAVQQAGDNDQRVLPVAVGKRLRPSEHLEEHRGEREDVGSAANPPVSAFELLRGA